MRKGILLFSTLFVYFLLTGITLPVEPRSATPEFVFPRLVSSGPAITRDVFTLKEIREQMPSLAPRLIADHIEFPLMVRPTDPVIQELLGAPGCARFGPEFIIQLSRPWCEPESKPVFDFLKKELAKQKIDRSRQEQDIEIDLIVFLANQETLEWLIAKCPDASEAGRQYLLDRIRELHQAGVKVLQFKQATLNGMASLEEMDEKEKLSNGEVPESPLEKMVAASEGMREKDSRSLLDINDTRDFFDLSLQRTAEIWGLSLEETKKRLASLSPSEAITTAAYFARSRMQKYASPIDQMRNLTEGDENSSAEWLQVGDCRHFAGLAVHYLNHVVKPNNPDLKHWYFGVQTDHIRTYHHAYVKAVQVREDGESLQLYFFDPTILAEQPVRRLTPKKIRKLIEATSRNDHFFELKRYAEDFLRSPLDPDAALGNDEIPIDIGSSGQVDLQPLIDLGE